MKQLVILFAIAVVKVRSAEVSSNPLVRYYPCNGTDDIQVFYDFGITPEDEVKYFVTIDKNFTLNTKFILKFDSDARVTLDDKNYARISVNNRDNTFDIRFFKEKDGINFTVQGPTPGILPYLISVRIDYEEYCTKPWVGVLDTYVDGYRDTAETQYWKPAGNCGKRQITHTELIVNGALTNPGEWPWHTALYRIYSLVIKYICGGTLISKNYVLTAAHCATMRGAPVLPETLLVSFGRFSLFGWDPESQERKIHSIIIHDQYNYRSLENDIAVLRLQTEVVFTDYIQPVCAWYPRAVDNLLSKEIFGTVVGWGFESTDVLAPQIRKATMPLISENTCLKSNPVFYSKFLQKNNKFCAGYRNGTSACNGDSGSGFQVFVPDTPRDSSPDTVGTWYVRGIVSVTLSRIDAAICDPKQYVVFTDVEKYRDWLEEYLH